MKIIRKLFISQPMHGIDMDTLDQRRAEVATKFIRNQHPKGTLEPIKIDGIPLIKVTEFKDGEKIRVYYDVLDNIHHTPTPEELEAAYETPRLYYLGQSITLMGEATDVIFACPDGVFKAAGTTVEACVCNRYKLHHWVYNEKTGEFTDMYKVIFEHMTPEEAGEACALAFEDEQ